MSSWCRRMVGGVMNIACSVVGFSSIAFFGQITAQDFDAEPLIVDGCTQDGGFSLKILFGHMVTNIAVTDLVAKLGKKERFGS